MQKFDVGDRVRVTGAALLLNPFLEGEVGVIKERVVNQFPYLVAFPDFGEGIVACLPNEIEPVSEPVSEIGECQEIKVGSEVEFTFGERVMFGVAESGLNPSGCFLVRVKPSGVNPVSRYWIDPKNAKLLPALSYENYDWKRDQEVRVKSTGETGLVITRSSRFAVVILRGDVGSRGFCWSELERDL